jgi:hypothetical protein
MAASVHGSRALTSSSRALRDWLISVESEITRGREKGRVTGWQRQKQKQCSGANKC